MLFFYHKRCSTCKKAKDFLDKNGIKYEERDIVEERPTKQELREYITLSKKEIKKFFNTSGMKYRELGLKDKLKNMSEDEMLDILSSDGMLVKRPLLVLKDDVLLGFKEDEYNKIKK